MSHRAVISVAVAAILGVACVSSDALAYRGFRGGGAYRGGVHRAGVYHGGGAYRGAYARRGVGWGLGAAAVGAAAGAAVAAPYYGRPACGSYPNPPCY
jgi:hypothetical protein